MKTVKVAIIGAGNISNTRHIPALNKLKNVEIVGVVGVKQKNIERTLEKYHISQSLLLESAPYVEALGQCDWFRDVDAVVIGAPPREHYAMVEAALLNDKHVLVEKPMTMDEAEADKLIALATQKNKIFAVMHNFQYTSGVMKLEQMMARGELGQIKSFYEFQLTNKNRRLPEWYNDLPLGLFFDEAPHFMYMLENFGGDLVVQNAYAHTSDDAGVQTPVLLNVSLKAGKYPASIFLNFDSPVCEWYFVVSGDQKIAFYDLFKDILIVLPTDNEHYAADILKNSWRATYQYWAGFIKNGFKMLAGNLLYGHDVVIGKYIDAIQSGTEVDSHINAESGKRTVGYMDDIVQAVKRNQQP